MTLKGIYHPEGGRLIKEGVPENIFDKTIIIAKIKYDTGEREFRRVISVHYLEKYGENYVGFVLEDEAWCIFLRHNSIAAEQAAADSWRIAALCEVSE